ncbi:Cytochrome c oxidase polypeptide VIc [Caligus rogercresseyi]|uniref:Cytochrome c oxidase polypeptide VIc n=1 Tax=Caligus rogercresseyi TaxID=217165 RepID=A0A7T8HKY5_CALRO|nr:Cytochrome c oxidase polypeptide VIc [Caligus rogercresseyi]
MSVAKPQLKGLFISRLKFQIPAVLAISGVISYGIYYFGYRSHKRAYEKFYSTYDAEEDFLRMKRLGLFNLPDAEELKETAIDTSSYLEEIGSLIRKYKQAEKKRMRHPLNKRKKIRAREEEVIITTIKVVPSPFF